MGHVVARFDCFAGTSAEARASTDLRLAAVAFTPGKPAWNHEEQDQNEYIV